MQSIYSIFMPVFEGDPFFQRSFGQPKLVIKTLTGTPTRWRARCEDQNGSRGGKERPSCLLVVVVVVACCLLFVACWLLVVAYRLLVVVVVVAVACWLLVVDEVDCHLFLYDPQGGCRPLNLRLWCELLDSRSFLKECVDGNPRSWGNKKYGKTLRLGSHCLHFLPSYTNCTCAGSFMFCFFDETMKHLVLEASSWLDSTVPLYLPSRNTFTYKSVQYIRCTLQRLRLCDLEVGLKDGHPKMSQTHESHMNFTKNSQEQMICGWSEVKFTVPSSFQFQKSRLTHSRVFCWTVLEKFTGWNMKYFPQETSQNQSPRSLQSLQLATQTPTSTLCRWSPGGGLVVVEAFSREQLKYNTGGPPDEERLVSCASRKPKQMWIHGIEDWLKVEVYFFWVDTFNIL